MTQGSLADLRAELARLEGEVAKLSALRDRLQDRIDLGFESETTRSREREISDERRELHRRIDSIRARLGERQTA
jgi:chromosome segregation ATPase